MANDSSLENMSAEERDSLARLAHGIANDPKTRGMFLRLTKAHKPEIVIPELEVEGRVAGALKSRDDKIASLESKIIERQAEDNVKAKRDELREQGYSNDDIKAIEKLMVDESIPSHKTASEFFRMQRQTAEPTPTAYRSNAERFKSIDKAAVKDAGGIRNWGRDEAHRAIDDLAAGRVKVTH